MTRRNDPDPGFDEEQIENQDPLGETTFEAEGFEDAPDGGPALGDEELADDAVNRRPAQGGQKVAGVPRDRQHEPNHRASSSAREAGHPREILQSAGPVRTDRSAPFRATVQRPRFA